MKEKLLRSTKDPKLISQDSDKVYPWNLPSNQGRHDEVNKSTNWGEWAGSSSGSVLIRTSMLDSELLNNGRAEASAPVQLEFKRDFMTMTENWTEEEKELGRRLVLFKFIPVSSNKYMVDCEAIRKQDFAPNLPIISCIYWKEKELHIVTSFDIILFLEYLARDNFSIEEKNRIRRNLQSLKPLTISRTSKQCHRFFVMLMGMEDPTPRNIEKDLKVFKWDVLVDAISKVMSKYSINPAVDQNGFDKNMQQSARENARHGKSQKFKADAGNDNSYASNDSNKSKLISLNNKSKLFKKLDTDDNFDEMPLRTRDELMDLRGNFLEGSSDLKGYDASGESMEAESNSKDSSDSALSEHKESTPSNASSTGSTVSALSAENGFSLNSGLNSKSESRVSNSNSNSCPSSGQMSANSFSNGASKQESQVTSAESSVGTFARVAGSGKQFLSAGSYEAHVGGSTSGNEPKHDSRYYQYPALSQLYPAKVNVYNGLDFKLSKPELHQSNVSIGKPGAVKSRQDPKQVELPSLMASIKNQSLLGDQLIQLPPIVSTESYERDKSSKNG